MSNPTPPPTDPSTSDFRVVRFRKPNGDVVCLDVCEVFYTNGQPYDCRPANPATPNLDVAHLRATLTNMTAALDRPALTYDIQRMDFIPTVEETYP